VRELEAATFASITHLRFDARLPLARDIAAYQKHRVKRLRRQPPSANSASGSHSCISGMCEARRPASLVSVREQAESFESVGLEGLRGSDRL
ncbi:MAG: hypothetical protein P4L92_20480, partial [Rudaea sp.]|nr:hypothetical protein [Rudaea sp.]